MQCHIAQFETPVVHVEKFGNSDTEHGDPGKVSRPQRRVERHSVVSTAWESRTTGNFDSAEIAKWRLVRASSTGTFHALEAPKCMYVQRENGILATFELCHSPRRGYILYSGASVVAGRAHEFLLRCS